MSDLTKATLIQDTSRRIIDNVARVIVGKAEVVVLMLVALLCEGHILIEDVPGIGKTTLAKAFARSLNITFKRIQFTPDLLPSDITGISYFNQKQQEFVFRPGPILANILLADEINRATPRTQAAMLEAMQEQQITVDGETRSLPRPFLVLATQNPVELEGTFPLPEAQLDRFLLRLKLGYPDDDEENRMLLRFEQDNPLAALQPVCQGGDVLQMIQGVRHIRVADNVRRYIVAICRTTRTHNTIELGVSPRGTMALYHASQALAALRGRDYVIPDDAKYLAPMVLTHRIILSPQIRLRGRNTETVIQEIVDSVPVPVEE